MLPVIDSLVRKGIINPMIVVIADNSCEPFNGSQYVNSILWGNYEDFMTIDLIAWVDSSFRTIPERNGRALMGQSMGAYGSFRYGILHKDKYRALAAHAGPVDFFDSIFMETIHTNVLKENQPGPPYFYDYENTGIWTRMTFLGWGAWAPNFNSPQKYINPPIVEFPY
jgi:S-formylglutathione hydrolase FrmB